MATMLTQLHGRSSLAVLIEGDRSMVSAPEYAGTWCSRLLRCVEQIFDSSGSITGRAVRSVVAALPGTIVGRNPAGAGNLDIAISAQRAIPSLRSTETCEPTAI